MPAPQHASEQDLVVKTEDAPAVGPRLAEYGSAEELDPDGLFLLRLEGDHAELPKVRREILERLDGVEWVEPLLLDGEGNPMVPTGELSVRFREKLSDDDLRRFAGEHGLDLRRRNEFVPEQAVFAPRERGGRTLPDQVERLRRSDEVTEAWTNTASRYRKL